MHTTGLVPKKFRRIRTSGRSSRCNPKNNHKKYLSSSRLELEYDSLEQVSTCNESIHALCLEKAIAKE